MLLVWLGEQITDRGIGNGISLVITIGILARLPAAGRGLWDMFFPASGESHFNIGHMIALILLLVFVVAGVIAVTQAERKVPVQYAQRAVGRKIYSGQTSFLPLKLNFAGVMPIIFASSILMVPQFVFRLLGANYHWPWASLGTLSPGALNSAGFTYITVYTVMILFFSLLHGLPTQFNELEIADDLKKNGGYVPGVRPGQAASLTFLHNAMNPHHPGRARLSLTPDRRRHPHHPVPSNAHPYRPWRNFSGAPAC